jgi:hypothetical protein
MGSRKRSSWSRFIRVTIVVAMIIPQNALVTSVARAENYGCNVPCPDCCGGGDGGGGNSGGASGGGSFTKKDLPGGKGGLGSGGGGGECCDEDGDGGGKAPGNPDAGKSSNPVFFLNGTAIERAIDLKLPGAVFGWSFFRSYDSGRYGKDSATTAVGSGWISGSRGPYLESISSSDIILIDSASATRQFFSGNGTVYDGPRDYHATIVKSELTDSSDLDGDTITTEQFDIFTLTEADTGIVFIFWGSDYDLPLKWYGRLRERTTRAYQAAGKAGTKFAYHQSGAAAGYVDVIIPAAPQDTSYLIDFD